MFRKKPYHKFKSKNNLDYWIFGKHSVIAAINNKERIINKIFISKTKNNDFLDHIKKLLNLYKKNTKIEIKDIDSFKKKFPNKVHQGIAANVKKLKNLEFSEFIYKTNTQKSSAVLLYKIQDPHNLGAIMRSAAAFNFKFVLLNKRNSSRRLIRLLKFHLEALITLK